MGSPTCPSCGAPVQFRSAAPYTVCQYCRSLLVRRDASLDAIGHVAQVPDDLSPLQLRTTGVFDRQTFTLVGRVRKTWAEGSWNEWCASFAQPQFGWLAEAQGDWVMTFEQSLQALQGLTPVALSQLVPGTVVTVAGRPFTVSDLKSVEVTAAEGDLDRAALTGTCMTSIDLRGAGVAFATIEIEGSLTRLYVGRFVEYDECRFANLRTLEGW